MTTAAASAGTPVNVPHIGFGHVWHTRLRPRRHRCIVPTFFLLVPMTYRLRHLLNRNTCTGSRRNIHAHYDLGNAFYALWLDRSMNYSSDWFQGDLAGDLAAA